MALIIAGGSSPAYAAAPKKSKAKTAKTPAKPSAEDLRNRIEKAYKAYDFENAISLQEQYIDLYPPEGSGFFDELESFRLGQNMLQRVENIAIIDSFTVDKDRFFEAYRLSAPSGQIVEALPAELASQTAPVTYGDSFTSPIFMNEAGDMAIWSSPDKEGYNGLMQSSFLADGTWDTPKPLPTADDKGWVSAVWEAVGFPFLMPDGTTLYFAADYDGLTLGGFDIFVTRNNGDGFLEPQNIGMPYNSPYDDYMLAIDEQTGAGWWATDRNQIPGKVTIYVFIPKELRINYPADAPDLISRAKIETIAGTGAPSENRQAVLKAIADVDSSIQQQSERDFQFAMPGGKVYEKFSDFRSPRAVDAMKLYLDTQFDLTMAEDELAEMRLAFNSGNADREKIISAEKRVDSLRRLLRLRANDVVKAETGQ